MASIVRLYYKTAGVETGGTNALTGLRSGGTLISSGDTEATPFPLATLAVGTVATLYYVQQDSSTGLDNGEDSAAVIAPVLPPGIVGCFTYNGTFLAAPTTGATIVHGGFQPLYVKQSASAAAPTQWATGTVYAAGARVYQSGAATTFYVCPAGQGHTSGAFETDLAAGKWTGENISTGPVEWTPGTRVGQVGTVTPTAGDASVVLAWDDISGEANYEVLRTTANDLTTNAVWLTTSLAAGSTGYTNNAAGGNAPTNGVTYWYHVRGVAATGVGPWSTTVSATPAVPDWFETGRGSVLAAYTFESGDESFTFGAKTARGASGTGLNGTSYAVAITQGTDDTFAVGPTFTNQNGTLWVEWYTKPEGATNRCGGFGIWEGTAQRLSWQFLAGSLDVCAAHGVASYTAGKVYRFRAQINIATDKITKFGLTNITDAGSETTYDNSGSGYAFSNAAAVLNSVRIGQYSPSGSGVSYFDEIRLWA